MRDLNTARLNDLEIVLNDCQQRQYPFIFWDEKEVTGFNLSLLPVLRWDSLSRGWKSEGEPYTVDLNHPKAVKALKATILKYIIGVEGGNREVAFAITKTENSSITVQVYFQ